MSLNPDTMEVETRIITNEVSNPVKVLYVKPELLKPKPHINVKKTLQNSLPYKRSQKSKVKPMMQFTDKPTYALRMQSKKEQGDFARAMREKKETAKRL